MITAILPPFSLIAMTGQPSYPLNSENASPFGTRTVYLAWAVLRDAGPAAQDGEHYRNGGAGSRDTKRGGAQTLTPVLLDDF